MVEETNTNVENKEEPKIVCAYTIYRFDNGNTQVDNAEVEGVETEKLTTTQILGDIIAVAKQVEEKRAEEIAYNATIRALDAYMTAVDNNRKAAEAKAREAAAQATVEMPEA